MEKLVGKTFWWKLFAENMDPIKKEIKEEHEEELPTQFLPSVKCEEEESQHSRCQLFTSVQILIRIYPLINVMRICDPPCLHFKPPRLHFERPPALHGSILSLESSWISTLMRIRILSQLFTLMRIRIQLPKTLRIRICIRNPDLIREVPVPVWIFTTRSPPFIQSILLILCSR